MPDEPDLRRDDGDNDKAWVEYLQGLLEAAGHSPGPIDGYFGPLTEGAVKAFQAASNCTVDGWVGPQTWGALNALQTAAAGQDSEGGDVPDDLVAAGAPAAYSDWTQEQIADFFAQAEADEEAEGESDDLEVAVIDGLGGEGSYA